MTNTKKIFSSKRPEQIWATVLRKKDLHQMMIITSTSSPRNMDIKSSDNRTTAKHQNATDVMVAFQSSNGGGRHIKYQYLVQEKGLFRTTSSFYVYVVKYATDLVPRIFVADIEDLGMGMLPSSVNIEIFRVRPSSLLPQFEMIHFI